MKDMKMVIQTIFWIFKKSIIIKLLFCSKALFKAIQNIIKRMADEGHLVCNRSAHHPSMAKITDFEKIQGAW